MRSVNLLITIMLVSNSMVLGQVETSSLWSKTYGGADDEVAAHVLVRRDGSLAINAQKTIFADASRNLFKSQADAWLFGLNEQGKLQWDQTLGGTGSDTFYVFAADEGAGLLLAGSTDSDLEKTAVWAVKTDSKGHVLLPKMIPADDDIAVNGGIAINGQLIVCGQEWGGLQKKWQGFVTALDENFRVKWKRSIGENEFDTLSSMVETADGNILALGRLGTESGFHDLLLKLDSSGQEVWRKVIPRPNGQLRNQVVASRDGSFTTFGAKTGEGEEGKDLWLQKFDASGKALWEKQISSAHDDSISHVLALADGGYLVAGSRETQFPDERRKFNATLSRLAADGTAVWQRSFPGDSHTGINGLAEGRSGTAIAVGAIVEAETKNSDAWVFTFTLDGDFPKAVTVQRY